MKWFRALPGPFPFILAGSLLAFYPSLVALLGLGSYWIVLGFQILIWVTLATSWNFFSGYSGYASFGHGAFFGLGMYTTATLLLRTNLPVVLALALSGGVAAMLAWFTGFVVFRLQQFRGELFSLLTLAMTFIVATVVNNVDWLDGGGGVFLRQNAVASTWGADGVRLYYAALVIALSCVYLAYAIYHTRWGQALFAIRDDEDVAEGLGVPTFAYKNLTFALSAFFAGAIAGPQALFLGYLETATAFAVTIPLLALMMAILGGAAVWYGPVLGALLVTLMRQLLTGGETAELNQIAIGMVFILTILFLPHGLAGLVQRR